MKNKTHFTRDRSFMKICEQLNTYCGKFSWVHTTLTTNNPKLVTCKFCKTKLKTYMKSHKNKPTHSRICSRCGIP
jgi:hypothetical protein